MSIKKHLSNYEPALKTELERRNAEVEELCCMTETEHSAKLPGYESWGLQKHIDVVTNMRLRVEAFYERVHLPSQIEPVCVDNWLDRYALGAIHAFPSSKVSTLKIWIYQNAVYHITGGDTEKEQKLQVLEAADKERQKFERLKAKFSKEQTEHVKYERSRIPESVRIEVWRRDQGKCAGCGSREKLEYDHIVPVSRGGSNTARNVELLCEDCNRTKGNRIQ